MADLCFLIIDLLALLTEWTLRLIFWLGRKLGWIKQTVPKPTRKQTIIGNVILLLLLVLLGLMQ
nr:hypothetical protein [uncultured Kingella sp.]